MTGPPATCADCDKEFDCCAFCGEPSCPVPICYECLNLALRPGHDTAVSHGG